MKWIDSESESNFEEIGEKESAYTPECLTLSSLQ